MSWGTGNATPTTCVITVCRTNKMFSLFHSFNYTLAHNYAKQAAILAAMSDLTYKNCSEEMATWIFNFSTHRLVTKRTFYNSTVKCTMDDILTT